MGLMSRLFSTLFGNGRNVISETVEMFTENKENAAIRDLQLRQAAMAQYGAEFQNRRGWFDQLVDGLNRLPRPALAYGTLGLFVMAMKDPEWFASRMHGVALVPEPLWWLMGAIVSFYFGARHQAHTQAFQRSIVESIAQLPQIAPRAPDAPQIAPDGEPYAAANDNPPQRFVSGPNAALSEWWALRMAQPSES